jgi:hypothetical protein
MAELLTDLLQAGLIENLGGDDERFAKIERAAVALGKAFCANPPLLIRAILAGLDPDIPPDDPAIAQAEQALVEEWKSVRSVFPDTPVGLLRAILLEACALAASEGNNAAILWLTAADSLVLSQLGREELVVRKKLEELASSMGNNLLKISVASLNSTEASSIEIPELDSLSIPEPRKVDRKNLKNLVAAATGPNYRGNGIQNSNGHWANGNQHWAWEFTDRMHALLADEMDELASDMAELQTKFSDKVETFQSGLFKSASDLIALQQCAVQQTLKAEQTRLNALWWSEALYSPSFCKSYRELPTHLAAAIMAVDLLAEVSKPTPASVGYLLAEAVNRLPEAGFERKFPLLALFQSLQDSRGYLPKDWLLTLLPPPEQGRLSLRDAAWLTLSGQAGDLTELLRRTGASADAEMSLPAFAHAFFRQEQAVQLAGSGR